MLHIKFGFDWPSGFGEKMFEYYDNIHVCCTKVGADGPLVSISFQNHGYSTPTAYFLQDFPFKCHLNSFTHSNA